MPPAPVRTPSKRSIAALPESSRLTFLLAASQLLASSVPQASSHLGCQALKWADTKQIPLPRGTISQLCRNCGAHCNSKNAMLIKNSRAQRRRQLQADTHTQNRHSEPRMAAAFPCQVCGSTYVRSFVNKDAAHKAFPQAAMAPTAKAAAQHPAGRSNHTAGAGLRTAASSQAHQPPSTPHSRKELPHNHQQAAGCADASLPEPEAAQLASKAIFQQPRGKDNRYSALARSSQPATSDPSADNAIESASVSSVALGSSLVPRQDADLSMQQHLTVNTPQSPQELLLELNHQQADNTVSLPHATQMETPQDSEHQTAQPVLHVGDQLSPQSDPSIEDTVQGPDGMKPHHALLRSEQENSASSVLQTATDTAFPVGEAQSGINPASVSLRRALEVAALRRRKPFSWRKHGRSWRRMASKEWQNLNGSF